MKAITDADSRMIYERLRTYFRTPGTVKTSLHQLKGGASSDYFFDLDYNLNDPIICEDIVLFYTNEVQKIARRRRVDFIGFIEKPSGGVRPSGGTVGAIRLAGAISIYSGIPNVVIRLSKHLLTERLKVPYQTYKPDPQFLSGLNSILVTDHISQGREIISAIETITRAGGTVSDIIAYTIRPDFVRWEYFEEKRVEIHAYCRLPRDPQEIAK
jgi:orotate phosphoribosyltransferase